jgi:glycosyltransferase involved in cell wall biosynthesis
VGRVLIAFEPPDGGVPEQVCELALGLPDLGWEVEVAGPAEASVYARLEEASARVHRLGRLRRGFSRPWNDAFALVALVRLLRRGHYDLIHCHSSKVGLLGRVAAILTRTPAVYTPHGFGFVGEVGTVRRALVPPIERLLARRTAALVLVCDAELALAAARSIGSEERRHRVYNGCEPCREVDVAAELLDLHPNRVVGTIAVFRREKGVDVVIDAAPRILAALPDAAVAVIGEGPLEAELRQRAQALGLLDDPRFRFIPFSRPMARYLRGLDTFVLASAWEAFPISILEALACGVPQVASDVGGIGEAVAADTGTLVPAGDAERLADAVIDQLADRKRHAAMAAASVRRFEANFRLERMIGEMADVYVAATARS